MSKEKYRRWTPQETELLTRLWSEPRIRTSTIGDHFGITRQAVQYKAKSLGLPDRGKDGTSKYDLNKLIEMWNEGYRAKDIQAAIRAPYRQTVRNLAYKLGLPRRSRTADRTGNKGGWKTKEHEQPDMQLAYAESMKASAEETKARLKRRNP